MIYGYHSFQFRNQPELIKLNHSWSKLDAHDAQKLVEAGPILAKSTWTILPVPFDGVLDCDTVLNLADR